LAGVVTVPTSTSATSTRDFIVYLEEGQSVTSFDTGTEKVNKADILVRNVEF
jgi:hypothetical protein